jgi:hypothetical protein
MSSKFKEAAITLAIIGLALATAVVPASAQWHGARSHGTWHRGWHGGGWGVGNVDALGILGALGGYPYGAFGGCTVVRPFYDQYGHYINDRPVSVC